jgi:hypothetical protein
MGKKKKARVSEAIELKDNPLFNGSPDDIMPDPRYEVAVSRQGKDKGSRKQALYHETMEVRGELQEVQVVHNGLYRMHQKGNICDDGYKAALSFQRYYELGKYEACTSVNLSGAPGGNMSIDDVYVRAHAARDYVHHVLDMLGGPTSRMSLAVVHYVGRGCTLEQISKARSGSNQYWQGMLHAALILMADDYKKLQRKRGRRTRSRGIQ